MEATQITLDTKLTLRDHNPTPVQQNLNILRRDLRQGNARLG